ncbi:MAG: hypothetical protein JSS27_03390 [Planctomycetes bacterium]|nr:hypothetical protein [Planctomycetota bacterium]
MRTLHRSKWLIVLAVGLACHPALAQPREAASAAAPAHKAGSHATRTFAEVVQAHFAEWDLNHDGKLDAKEIDTLMNRSQIKGEAAAALATIKQRERMRVAATPGEYAVSEASLLHGADQGPIKALDAAQGAAKEYRYEPRFQQNLKALTTLTHRLFAGDGPDFKAMRQGSIGDCFFFSVTGNIAAHHPSKLKQMISPQSNGAFEVRFPDGTNITVQHVSDAEMLVNNSAASLEDGLWLTVLEKAFGQRMRATAPAAKRTGEVTDAIASGGSTGKVIEMYTGHEVERITLRDPEHEKARLAELRQAIPAALARGHLVGVGMSDNPPKGHQKVPKLGYGHAYAIFKYDHATDQVTMWNPWGNDFTPKGTPGVENGFETKHGIFHVSLKTLYRQFSSVLIETGKPLTANHEHPAAGHKK